MSRTDKTRMTLICSLTLFILIGVTAWFLHITRLNFMNRTLIQAVKQRDASKVQWLLDQGADVDARDTPNMAVRSFRDWLRLLNPTRHSTDTPTALLIAMKKNLYVAEVLVRYGANVNVRDKDGNTPLILAGCYDLDGGLTRLLLDRGANIHATNKYGMSALFNAVSWSTPKVIGTLMDHGADINARLCTNDADETILEAAVSRGEPHVVQKLIDKGAVIRGKDNRYGLTLVHLAARVHDSRCLRLLIDRGMDINARDNEGMTPLMHAIISADMDNRSNSDDVRLLLDRGADVNIKNNDGLTALQLANLCLKDQPLVDRIRRMTANSQPSKISHPQ